MAKVGASGLLRIEDLPNFPPEWEPLLRQINQGQGGLQNAVNGGLTLDDNLSLERVTVNLSHGVPQLVRLKKLASAAGAIVLGVAGSGTSNYALAIPLILTSTSTPNQVKLTAYFTDSTAMRVKVSVLLFKEGVVSSAAPAAPSAGGAGAPGVRAYYIASGAQTVANNTVVRARYDTLKTDTNSAVTTGAGWKFVVPAGKGGAYLVTAAFDLLPATGQMTDVFMSTFNDLGTELKTMGGFNLSSVAFGGTIAWCGSCVLELNAGDDFHVIIYQKNSAAVGVASSGSAIKNWISIYGPLP